MNNFLIPNKFQICLVERYLLHSFDDAGVLPASKSESINPPSPILTPPASPSLQTGRMRLLITKSRLTLRKSDLRATTRATLHLHPPIRRRRNTVYTCLRQSTAFMLVNQSVSLFILYRATCRQETTSTTIEGRTFRAYFLYLISYSLYVYPKCAAEVTGIALYQVFYSKRT